MEGARAALSADNGSYLLQACSDGIVRCSYSPKEPNPNYSALGISPPQTSKCVWKAAETADTLSLQAGSIQLDIGLSSGHFLWRDAATGKELLQEGNKELTSVPRGEIFHRRRGAKNTPVSKPWTGNEISSKT